MKSAGVILFWVWTLALAVLLVYLVRVSGQSSFYEGQEVEINVGSGQTIVIPQIVKVVAAASGYFLIDNRSGIVIFGEKIPKPIGWMNSEYWFTESQMTAGNWIVQDGSNITIQLSSERVASFEVIPDVSSVTTARLLLIVLFVGIWFVSLILIAEFK